MDVIYMDNAATSYPKPEAVYQAIDRFNRNLGGNPGRGSSKRALAAGSVLLETREALARLFKAGDGRNIVFTLNVTEALNTGLKGILKPGDHVVTTSMEHNAVARPLTRMEQMGVKWTRVQCGPDGRLDPLDVRQALLPSTKMICLLHASNVTGTIMPIDEVGKISREHGLIFMVDAASTAGLLNLDVERQNIDLLAFAGHKGLMGPQGTGGLYVRKGIKITPLKEGGTGSLSEKLDQPCFMPDWLESGTPNTPGIAGLLAGVRFIEDTGPETIRKHESRQAEMLLRGLMEIPGVKVYGPRVSKERTAVISFNIEDIDCGEVSLRLEHDFGIISRSGLHCAPLAHQTIGTLEQGSCRLSPGFFTTDDEISRVIQAVSSIARS